MLAIPWIRLFEARTTVRISKPTFLMWIFILWNTVSSGSAPVVSLLVSERATCRGIWKVSLQLFRVIVQNTILNNPIGLSCGQIRRQSAAKPRKSERWPAPSQLTTESVSRSSDERY
jgi:hypothetical protein